MADAVSLLHGLKDALRDGSAADFRNQCTEHANFRRIQQYASVHMRQYAYTSAVASHVAALDTEAMPLAHADNSEIEGMARKMVQEVMSRK